MQVFSGLDWLGLTCYGANVVEAVRAELLDLKGQAEHGSEEYILLGGVPWKVEGYGFGRGASHMHFVLRSDGLTMAIANRDKSPCEGGGPVCMLTATGQYCAGKDPLLLQKDLETCLEMCGFTLFRIGVNRVDFHTDIVGVPIREVLRKLVDGKVVTRARNYETTFKGKLKGEIQTIYIGSRSGSDTHLCVYDKAAELLKDPIKTSIYLAAFGLDEMPEIVTRYEWRLNGDALREQHNVLNLGDLMSRLQSIYCYLSTEWYRECETVDVKNPQRSVMCPVWAHATGIAQNQFKPGAERCRRPAAVPEPDKLIQQVKGCLATICAVLGVLPDNAADAVNCIMPQLSSAADEWKTKVMKRAGAFKAMVSLSVLSFEQRRQEFEFNSTIFNCGAQ